MPQEFHVLRCFSCSTFQVHIVKKSNKWICKMCGEKQSLKKVYSQGSGKDCRKHVQALNERRILEDQNISVDIVQETEQYQHTSNFVLKESKWSEYITEEKDVPEIDVDQNDHYTFERPNKRKYSKNKEQYENYKRTRQNIDENIVNHLENHESEEIQNENIKNEQVLMNKSSKWNSFIQSQEDEIDLLKTEEESESSKRNSCMANNEKNTSNLSLNIYNYTDMNSLDDILNI